MASDSGGGRSGRHCTSNTLRGWSWSAQNGQIEWVLAMHFCFCTNWGGAKHDCRWMWCLVKKSKWKDCQHFSGSIYNGIHLHRLAVIGNLQRLYLFDAHFGTVLFLELSMHQNWLRLSLLWPLSECHVRHQHSHSTMKRLIQLIPNPSKLVHPFSDFRSTHHIYPIDSIHFIPFPHHQPFLLGSGSWTPRNCACMERSNLEPCCHWLQLLPNEGSSWLGRYRAWRWSFMPLYLTTNIYQYPPRNESIIPPSKTETIIFNIPKRPILTPSPRNPNGSIKAHSVHSNVPTAR